MAQETAGVPPAPRGRRVRSDAHPPRAFAHVCAAALFDRVGRQPRGCRPPLFPGRPPRTDGEGVVAAGRPGVDGAGDAPEQCALCWAVPWQGPGCSGEPPARGRPGGWPVAAVAGTADPTLLYILGGMINNSGGGPDMWENIRRMLGVGALTQGARTVEATCLQKDKMRRLSLEASSTRTWLGTTSAASRPCRPSWARTRSAPRGPSGPTSAGASPASAAS